jgi:hypothetical protein
MQVRRAARNGRCPVGARDIAVPRYSADDRLFLAWSFRVVGKGH